MYRFLIVVMTVFLVAFPKGGFKVSEIPITWGYIFLVIIAFVGFLNLLIKNGTYFKKERQLTLLFALPFMIYSSFILLFSEKDSLGFVLSYYLSVVIMPIIFLYIFNSYIDYKSFDLVFKPTLKNCVRFVAVFGLALFFLKLITKQDFEIPYLTANIDEAGKLQDKYNMRGDITKLISTYNNGNIYGVALMLLLPTYFQIENRLLFKILLVASMILTLSRTVWIGLILYLMLTIYTQLKTVKGWAMLLSGVSFIVFLTPIMLNFLGRSKDFLFDSDLGGRSYQLTVLSNISLFGGFVYVVPREIIYLSIISNFGLVGITLFIFYLLAPIIADIIYLLKKGVKLSPATLKRPLWGPLIYVVMAGADAAFLLIPVMSFFWFVNSYAFKPQLEDQ